MQEWNDQCHSKRLTVANLTPIVTAYLPNVLISFLVEYARHIPKPLFFRIVFHEDKRDEHSSFTNFIHDDDRVLVINHWTVSTDVSTSFRFAFEPEDDRIPTTDGFLSLVVWAQHVDENAKCGWVVVWLNQPIRWSEIQWLRTSNVNQRFPGKCMISPDLSVDLLRDDDDGVTTMTRLTWQTRTLPIRSAKDCYLATWFPNDADRLAAMALFSTLVTLEAPPSLSLFDHAPEEVEAEWPSYQIVCGNGNACRINCRDERNGMLGYNWICTIFFNNTIIFQWDVSVTVDRLQSSVSVNVFQQTPTTRNQTDDFWVRLLTARYLFQPSPESFTTVNPEWNRLCKSTSLAGNNLLYHVWLHYGKHITLSASTK